MSAKTDIWFQTFPARRFESVLGHLANAVECLASESKSDRDMAEFYLSLVRDDARDGLSHTLINEHVYDAETAKQAEINHFWAQGYEHMLCPVPAEVVEPTEATA